MYIPEHFRVSDPALLADFIERNSFGILITSLDGAPFATHLPFLLDRASGPHGTLLGHVARANPHAEALAANPEALVIFHGPHAYVSPTWYQDPKSVPTWNYTAVHVHGRPRPVESASRTLDILSQLTARFEAADSVYGFGAGDTWVANLARGIVAFEMPIDRIEGKFKLSQNRPPADRIRVAGELSQSAFESERETARLMQLGAGG